MILLVLGGCASWVFDARVWNCDSNVTIESRSDLTVRATNDGSECRVRATGLGELDTVRNGDALFLSNASEVTVEGSPNLYSQWEAGEGASLIEIDREEASLRLLSEGPGQFFVDDTIEVQCENCSLRGEVWTDFTIRLEGAGTSSICVRQGVGRIRFGSGILELHGNVSNIEVEGGGVLLTSLPEEQWEFDVPAVGFVSSRNCETTLE